MSGYIRFFLAKFTSFLNKIYTTAANNILSHFVFVFV